jgi:hypothetical protein
MARVPVKAVAKPPKRPKPLWVRSLPSPLTERRHTARNGSRTVAQKKDLTRYGHVWHAAFVHPEFQGRTRLDEHGHLLTDMRTACGRDVPEFWDTENTRKSQPTKLKESDRICSICLKALSVKSEVDRTERPPARPIRPRKLASW